MNIELNPDSSSVTLMTNIVTNITALYSGCIHDLEDKLRDRITYYETILAKLSQELEDKDKRLNELCKELGEALDVRQWRLTSVELPVEDDLYLVSLHHPENGFKHAELLAWFARFEIDDYKFDIDGIPYDVTPYVEAWMHLPEPFSPAEDKTDG